MTAEGFLGLFNQQFGTDYKVVELGDAPDVRCQDSKGRALGLEITLTEDRLRDIQAALGRSDHRNAEDFSLSTGSSLQGNVLEQAAKRIRAKLYKRYGTSTALIVRDTSSVEWNWSVVIDALRGELNLEQNPFDEGVWILNRAKTKIYQIM